MTKIEALERTIYNLENDVFEYNWKDYDSCNCGILSRTILNGKNQWENGFNQSYMFNITKYKAGPEFSTVFKDTVKYCKQTNTPLPLIWDTLKYLGFTVKEMMALEKCSEEKEGVIKYLKAWVEILKEEKMIEEQDDKRSVASKEQSGNRPLETKRKHLPASTIFYEEVEEVLDLKIKGYELVS